MRMPNAAKMLPVLIGFALLSASACAQENNRIPADDEIRDLLMLASLALYDGVCPCPDSFNRNNDRCGKNSAYSKGGGAPILCYRTDVTPDMVKRYRDLRPKR